MATMTVTIGGVDRSSSVILSTVSIELNADRVGSTATFSMTDPSPRTGSSPIRPTERQAVTIVYDSITLFAGEISAIDTQYAPRELTYEITLQSYEAVFAATEVYATVSYVGTSGQQNTASNLRFTFDGDEAARIVNTYISSSIGVTAAVGGTGKVTNLLTRAFRMARGTGASQRRVLDYKNGSVADALDKIARVAGARWWIDGDKKLNWAVSRANLVGKNYDIEAASPLTSAGSWVRTASTGPTGTNDWALVTSTAATSGYVSATATPGLRYYFGAHGRPTTASNLFVELAFYNASNTQVGSTTTITYTAAATYAFKNQVATAPANTATVRLIVRNGATATQSRVDNLLLLEESAGFGVSDAPGALEIAPEVYSAPSDFQSPCNQVRIKGKTTAGTGLRYEKFSQALYGTYAMTHEDAQSESTEDVDAAAQAIFDSRAFPQKRHAYRTRWSATTKVLKPGTYQILRFASINDLDIQRVQAIRYEWNTDNDCVMYVALGAPPGALGQGLARVGSGVYGVVGPQVGTSVAEVTSPKATLSATVDTTATKPVLTSTGSFGYSGGGLRPATATQRASTTAPVADTLPDLPAPELPPGSLYALFPAAGDTILTRATLYRVSDDGLTWAAATSATLTADAVAAGTTGSVLIGEQIVAGTLDANSVNVTNINATNITTGTLTSIAINSGSGRFLVDSAGNATANSVVLGSTASSVSLAAKTSTTATITTSAAHPFIVGDSIAVALTSGPTNYAELNGVWTVTAKATTTITFTTTGTSTVASGAAVGSVSYGAGNDSTGKVALVPTTTQGAALLQVQTDATGSLYTEVGINSATAGSSTTDSTVTTDSAHGFVAGQFVSFQSTGDSTWNAITASLPVQIKTVPSTTTFTIRPSVSLSALTSNNAGTVRAYKRLSIVAPGGAYVYQSGTTPGVLGSGSLVLGSSLATLGQGGLATVADGEIGFLTATTPRYGGGGSLYSRTGSSDVSTSGDFILGTSNTSVQGDIRFKTGTGGRIGAFSTTSGNTSIGVYNSDRSAYAPIVASGFFPNQGTSNLSHNGTNFTMNDTVAITGGLTTTTTIVATGSITTQANFSTNSAGLFHDTPTGVTLASGSTVGRTALWTLNTGTQYNLQRWTSTSTAALKKNIRATDLAPDQIYNLDLVDFEYDLDKFAELYPQINVEATGDQRGVIWEQVADVMPEAAVQGYGPGDPPTIDWEKLYFGALVAIQDLNERLKALEEQS